DSTAVYNVDEQIDELKKSVREDVIKQSSKNQNLLSDKEKLRASVWGSLEHNELMYFQDLLLTTDERLDLTEEIMQQLIGYGIIDPLVRRDENTKTMKKSTDKIVVEKNEE